MHFESVFFGTICILIFLSIMLFLHGICINAEEKIAWKWIYRQISDIQFKAAIFAIRFLQVTFSFFAAIILAKAITEMIYG